MSEPYKPYSARRFYDDPGWELIICTNCKYRHRCDESTDYHLTCDAFPEGIPKGLILRNEHDTPYPGDHGIRFEPKDE